MKVYFAGILLLFFGFISAQELNNSNAIDVNYFTGNVMLHSPGISHLITGHPEGVMVSFSRKTNGQKEWHSVYNYPDYGIYFLGQDFKNDFLGKNYAIGAHYNFYFLNRKLMLKVAEGIAITTNPYNKETNSKNNAFGSKIMANTDFFLNYKEENIIDNFGVQAGFVFTHFSNGRVKSPNSGINTYNINFGINYNFDKLQQKSIDTAVAKIKFTQPIKYNFILRTGINESPIIGSGQRAFYHIGFYADKRLNRKSAIQLGTEVFVSNFYKDFIKYQSVAYPKLNLDPNTDYKRAGVFIGYELFINRISLEAQVGYYVYQPYKHDIPVYDRIGMKYYFGDKVYTGLSIKTHGFLAE
ncbi:MAG: acyloxyacyl hydrolase, partial [Flavobacterium sp.]